MTKSILPPNATEAERHLELTTARLGAVPNPVRAFWRPDACPTAALPWLAWALSLDNWSPDWPEAVKRERIRQAIPIARRKGTAESVRDVIRSFGGAVAIREWWEQTPRGEPFTFSLVMNLEQGGAPATAAFVEQVIAEVDRAKPARAHFTFTQGFNAAGAVALGGFARPATYARLSFTAPAV